MNIIIVALHGSHIGGVSSHIGMLEKSLKSRGHHVTLITENHFKPSRILVRAPFKILYKILGRNYSRWLLETMINRIQEIIIDVNTKLAIVHCHDFLTAFACGRISKDYGFGLVCTVHGPSSRHFVEYGMDPQSPEFSFIEACEKEAWSRCHRIIAVDTGQKDILLEQGAPKDIISVIPNAVDIDEIDCYKTANNPLPYRYLLVPRRLTPKTGVEYAIRALECISDSDIRMVVAGDGPLRRQLEELARSLRLTSRVVFLGSLPRHEVIRLAWHATAILIPSIKFAGFAEATSIAALEGMAAARPVIASAVGGLLELIQDGENGFLVPEKNPQMIAQKVEKVLTESAPAERLGKQARRTVIDRFSTSTWVQKIEDVYKEVDLRSKQRSVSQWIS